MKKFFMFFLFLSLFASTASATCPHNNGAAGICPGCYNQAIAGYTTTYGTAPIQTVRTTTYEAAPAPVAAYGDAESVTTTTVTEKVIQSAPQANATGLIVKETYVTPQTTYLVPSTTTYGTVGNFGSTYGNHVSGAFGSTYGSVGNFGSTYGSTYSNHVNGSFGGFNGYNAGNFGSFNHRGTFGNFRSGHGNVNNAAFNAGFRAAQTQRNFNARGQQVNGAGKVQALPRLRNAVGSLLGR